MTDNEIIKAFECCCLYDVMFCDKCPNKDTCGEIDVGESILDLINRLKAENKKNENIIRLADKTIETQNAEIERLKKQLDDKCDRCIARDKFEARKEFAERLCADRVSNDPVVIAVKAELKEMGDDNA